MKTQLIILCVCLLVGMSSCRKDKGDYTYQEINDMTISNIEGTYTALVGKRFKIEPVIALKNSSNQKEDDFTYEWTAADATSISLPKKVLGNGRILDLDLALLPSKYMVYFRVTEKSTNIYWQKQFELNVTSEIAGGWLVLNELNNEGRLDMLNFKLADNTFTYYRDILTIAGDLKIQGKPSFVFYTRNRDIFNNSVTDRVYIGTDTKTYSIDNQSYTWNKYRDFKLEVMRPTVEPYHAVKFRATGNIEQNYMLDSEGILSLENIVGNSLYGTTLNRLSTGARIEISPIIAENFGTGSPYLIMYDKGNRKFIVHTGSSSVAVVPRAATASPDFDPANMKKDLLFMDCVLTTQKQFYALLQDPASKELSLLRFTASGGVFTLLSYETIANENGMDRANFYTVDPTYGYLVYASGNKVYSYNPFNKEHKLLSDMGNRQISLVKYQRITRLKTDVRLKEYGTSLMICTYNPAAIERSGKMEFFTMGLNNSLTPKQSYDGFDKIVDVTYRE
ncbi:MAG TPA: PKD-like family lipoprotein, partial [Pedobacter sp.]|nr:PKD-like family lipoprotein [Pedobacter sp.]